jgi:cytochrome c oxidase cbb3-type subunit III
MQITRILGLVLLIGITAGFEAAAQDAAAPPQQGAAAPPPNGAAAPKFDPAAVVRGQAIFVSTCGFCHGTHATGGEKGPDLLRSVLVLDDEHGASIGHVIMNGRPDKGMPKFAMTQQQIADIAAFLHNSIAAAADRDKYQILNIVTGDAKAGEAYFNGPGNCSSCHSITGDLKGIGAKYEPVTLQDKILMPRDRWAEGSSSQGGKSATTVTVTDASGRSTTGTLLNIDDFTVALKDAGGNYRSFTRRKDTPRVEIHNPLQAHLDMLTKYTDTDIHNLTAFLVTLK